MLALLEGSITEKKSIYNETFWVIFKHCVAIKQWKFEVFKILQMSKLNRWLAHFQQHMCDMDPTIKLNTSFFQLATIFLLCLLEDLIFYSRTPRPLPIFQPIFSFQVSGLTRDLLALLEQLLWFCPILFEVKMFHFKASEASHVR